MYAEFWEEFLLKTPIWRCRSS